MIGEILNNRYKILKVIGTGGMSVVYEGYDTILSRNVAIKILKDNYLEGEDSINSLKFEAQASASITDENIVSIYDVQMTNVNGKNIEYIVMEKVEGKTLKEIIADEAPLSTDRILKYAIQITKALQTAHLSNIIHRDIKPANILITKDDKVKVTDFGIARVSTEATITYTSSILGTVYYISPEQAKGQIIDTRSDLYSLGVLLFEMATGEVPFEADSPVSIAVKHIQEKPKLITEINSNADKNLALIIDKLLEKNPEDRYKTSSNLLIDLNKLSGGKQLEIANNQKEELKDTKKQNLTSQIVNKVSRYRSENKKVEDIEEKKNPLKNKWIIAILAILLIAVGAFGISKILDNNIKRSIEASQVTMPSVLDLSEEIAIERLQKLGLNVEIEDRIFDDNIAIGKVISQSEKAQKKLEKGSIVRLVISKGKETIRVPRLIDYDLNQAESMIKKAGFEIGDTKFEKKLDSKNKVIKQYPEPDELAEKGSKINLVISEEIKVPNLIGLKLDIAKKQIKDSGFNLGNIEEEYSNAAKDTIIDQNPKSSDKASESMTINLKVSKGMEEKNTTIVPNLTGLSQSEAIREINERKLNLINVDKRASNETKEDHVISQSLEAGKEVPKNSEISIVVSSGRSGSGQRDFHLFVFKLKFPENKSSFNLRIINNETGFTAYNRKITKSDANSNGIIKVEIRALKDSTFTVYYDDEKMDTDYE